MKKKLFLLPLIGGFLLAGCQIKIGDKVINIGGGGKDKDTSTDGGNKEEEPELPTIMREYGDYKLAETIEDGGRYLLGNFRRSGDHAGEMRFFNGSYHKDPSKPAGKQDFSFYLGTDAAVDGDTSFAAEIEVKMLENGEFNMLVHAPGKVWDNCYIGVYPGKGISRHVISTARLTSPNQKTFTVVDGNGKQFDDEMKYEYEVTPEELFTSFKFFSDYTVDGEAKEVKAPGIEYQYVENDEEEPLPKLFGTADNYVSLDMKSAPDAVDPNIYDLAHFYVHK